MTDTTAPKRVLTLHMELSGSYDLERMFRGLLKDDPETADVLLSMSDKELEWALTEKEHTQIPFEILVAAFKHMRIQIDVETEPYADELLDPAVVSAERQRTTSDDRCSAEGHHASCQADTCPDKE